MPSPVGEQRVGVTCWWGFVEEVGRRGESRIDTSSYFRSGAIIDSDQRDLSTYAAIRDA